MHKSICIQCNKEFTYELRGKDRKLPRFCSRECWYKTGHKTCVCKMCGKEFDTIKSAGGAYCSRACSDKKHDPTKKSTFICKWCGKEFIDWSYRKTSYCSKQCLSEYASRQPKPRQRRPENFIVKVCEICNKEYTVHKCQDTRKNGTKSRFCSNTCKAKFFSINMVGEKNKNYIHGIKNASYRGPNWGAEARAIRKRDNYTCNVCGKNGKTDRVKISVHHIIPYRGFGGDYISANNPNNLISLCNSCHKKVECGKIKVSRPE